MNQGYKTSRAEEAELQMILGELASFCYFGCMQRLRKVLFSRTYESKGGGLAGPLCPNSEFGASNLDCVLDQIHVSWNVG